MNNFSLKMIAVALLIVVSVFFGMDMARNGIEAVHGPLIAEGSESAVPKPPSDSADKAGAHNDGTSAEKRVSKPLDKPQVPASTADDSESTIHYAAGKVGGLLHIMAHHSIETVVSLIDKVLR